MREPFVRIKFKPNMREQGTPKKHAAHDTRRGAAPLIRGRVDGKK
jgi:hypothetical protein